MDLDKKAQKALNKGSKKIPEFQKYFPQGEYHQVFKVSAWQYLSKCDVISEGIYYLGQNIHKPNYALFAEISSEINQDYAFVYYLKNKFFSFVPLTPDQKDILDTLNADFYKTWLYTKKSKFNPKKAVFNPINFVFKDKKFQKGVKIFKKLYRKIRKILKKKPETFPNAIKPELEKINKKLQKSHGDIQLLNKFDSLYSQIRFLNHALNENLGYALNNFKFKASAGDKAKSIIGSPAFDLKIEPIYIIPNGKTTIPIVLIPSQGFSFKLFTHYQAFYSFVKELYSSFKSLET